jgi:hypothetical protein
MRNHDEVQLNAVALTDDELSTVSAGKLDSFLKIDGIKGESTEKTHRDWIDIPSW